MRNSSILIGLLSFVLLLSSVFAAAQARLENAGALSDASVAAAVRAAVEPSGAKLVRPDGSTLCEIWRRKALPAAKAAAKGAGYADLAQSMLVGVISFPNGGKDFRGQAIKPGYYTMRYELLPEDGNHMGVAPTRDFVLLLPAGTDSDPNAQYDFAQMVKLSAQAAGTNHPAAFVMVTPEKDPTLSAPNPGADKGGATAAENNPTLSAPNPGADKDGATAAENNPTLSAPNPGADKGGATAAENNPTLSAPNPGADKGGATAPEKDPTLSPANPAGDKGGATGVRTYQNADGYQVFAGALKTASGKSVPIALVVKGQAEQ